VPEPNFMNLGMYIMASEPISKAYFINPSHQSVCAHAYPSISTFPPHQIKATIEKLLRVSICVRSVQHQTRVSGSVHSQFSYMNGWCGGLKAPRAVREQGMVMTPSGLETKNNCGGEGQQQFSGFGWKGLLNSLRTLLKNYEALPNVSVLN
jgi:hypothetical protein